MVNTIRGGNWRISYCPGKYGREKPWEVFYAGSNPPVSIDEDLIPFSNLQAAVKWLEGKGVCRATLTEAITVFKEVI